MTPATVTSTVRVGAYALEVGADSGSFAQFESEREEVNAQTLGAALTEEQEEPTFVAAVEELNESASAVTNKIERAHGLFRAAAEGRLLDRDVLMGEIDELLGLSERLDRAKRFEEQLRLARALHGLLAVTFRWLDLIRSLRRALQSAKEARDRAGEAWALHELGSLYLCAGDAKTAARSFREAFRIQEQLGGGGWCATRHNLDCARRDLAAPSAGSLTDPRRPRGRLARLLTIRGAKGIVVFLLLVLLVATGGTAAGIAVTRHGAPLQPALDRETLTFGASLVGETSPPKTLVLRAGSEAIVFSRVTVGRDDEFLVDDRCPTRLAARAACAIELRFRPSAPGLRTSWLSVKLGKAGIVSAELVGTAREAVDAAFSPSSLEFGEVELGAASESKTLTLTAGSKKLTILGIATGSDEFRVSSHCPRTLATGGSCEIAILFKPAASGPRAGKLTVTREGGSALASELHGTGLTPIAPVLSPSSLEFGEVELGAASESKTLTLTAGSKKLTILGIASDTGEFQVRHNCPPALAARASCTIQVVFAPTRSGPRTATLEVDVASGKSPRSRLMGSGVQPPRIQPTSVNFGQVVVGAPKTTGLRLIAGSKPVTVVAVRTNDPKHFPATTTCLGQLDPGTSCAVTVSFTPLAAGTRRALLSVSFSDRAALTVPLGGEGIEAVIQLEPTSLDFGPVAADMPDSLTKTVSLTNTGSAPLTITTITSSDRQFSVESRCASTVAVGNSCVFEVTFNPSSVRNHSAIITINANGRGQHRLSVVGEGVVG